MKRQWMLWVWLVSFVSVFGSSYVCAQVLEVETGVVLSIEENPAGMGFCTTYGTLRDNATDGVVAIADSDALVEFAVGDTVDYYVSIDACGETVATNLVLRDQNPTIRVEEGELVTIDSGTVVVSDLVVSGGHLVVNSDTVIQGDLVAMDGAVVVFDGALLVGDATIVSAQEVSFVSSSISGGQLTVSDSDTVVFEETTVEVDGEVSLESNNTLSVVGSTIDVAGGVVVFNGNGTILASESTIKVVGGSLAFDDNTSFTAFNSVIRTKDDGLSFTNNTVLTTSGSTVKAVGGALTFENNTSFLTSNSDIKTRGGTLIFSGNGEVEVQNSTIKARDGSLSVEDNTMFSMSESRMKTKGGSLSFENTALFAPNSILRVRGGGLTVGGGFIAGASVKIVVHEGDFILEDEAELDLQDARIRIAGTGTFDCLFITLDASSLFQVDGMDACQD